MKKNKTIKWYNYLLLGVLFITGLAFIYPFTINNYNGDSNQYFSWIKDLYTLHGGYFSWTTAAGYNQFSIIHLFSAAIGSFTYKSPSAFFLVVNYTELILLPLAVIIFIKLINVKFATNDLIKWIYGLTFFVMIWTLINLFAGSANQSVAISATDLFLIFVDSFIIISIGWFLFLINSIFVLKKVPKVSLISFIIFSLYFSLTTLRFISGALLTEIVLYFCLIIRSIYMYKVSQIITKPNKENKAQQISNYLYFQPTKKSLVIFLGLGGIFLVGYYGFFMVEPYSTSARFVLGESELSTLDALNNALTALKIYFNFSQLNLAIILLRLIYLIVLGYGCLISLFIILPKKSIKLNLNLMQLFGLLTAINFILVTLAGLFSHEAVFHDIKAIAHYYELSAIFAFLSVIAFIFNQYNNFKRVQYISLFGMFSCTIFSIYYINMNKNVDFKTVKLLTCINVNKDKYQLKNGMGDFWVVNQLMAQTSDTRFSVIGSMATNLDYNWQSNLTEFKSNTNFLVYNNPDYKQNALNLIKSKIPTLNYTEIDCGNNSGIVVFDNQTTSYIDKFRSIEFNNAKAWLYINNYGLGQTIWGKMPWNQKFIESYHTYYYLGSLLKSASHEARYLINNDFSIEVDGQNLSQMQPVLMTEMIHAGSGSYSINLNYHLTGSEGALYVINLTTQQPIANIAINSTQTYAHLDFNLYNMMPIAIILDITPGSKLLLKNLSLNKQIPKLEMTDISSSNSK